MSTSSADRAAAKRKILADVRKYAAKGMAEGLRPKPSAKAEPKSDAPTAPPEPSDADVAAALAGVEI